MTLKLLLAYFKKLKIWAQNVHRPNAYLYNKNLLMTWLSNGKMPWQNPLKKYYQGLVKKYLILKFNILSYINGLIKSYIFYSIIVSLARPASRSTKSLYQLISRQSGMF